MILLDGKKLAGEIAECLRAEVAKLPSKPKLSIILVGDDPASLMYDNMKIKKARELGMEAELLHFKDDISEDEILAAINRLNLDPGVDGIMVQMPMPPHLDETWVCSHINPSKDVDGLCPYNKGMLSMYNDTVFLPATVRGIKKLIEHYGVPVEGQDAVVVGASNIVGKPAEMMLLNMGATVSICHSRTKNLASYTKRADIIISAAGVENLITANMVKKGVAVIDVAMLRSAKTGKLCGDVDIEGVARKASFITPVPGGVGPMTVIALMSQLVEAYHANRRA